MLVITKKLRKRDLLIAVLVIAAIAAVLLLPGKSREPEAAEEAQIADLSTNEGRVSYLQSLGYVVEETPVKERAVRFTDAQDEVFVRYNELQRAQGFDLTQYAGKTGMQYIYRILNDPSGDVDLYATLLVCDGKVIGGDVASKSASGVMRALIPQQ